MTQKHTPGPWEINIGIGDYGAEFCIHNGVTICRGDDEAASWKENAHLIAAAPELLEALVEAEERLVDLWELYNSDAKLELTGGSVVGNSAARRANELWVQIENIRAAIAKARGQ